MDDRSHGTGKTYTDSDMTPAPCTVRSLATVQWPPTLQLATTIIASNDFFSDQYVVRGGSTFRQERRPQSSAVQKSHNTTQQHRSPSRCGCERINQHTIMHTPFRVGNTDGAYTVYGRAVLPCSELVHDTHPSTRNQIIWLVLCRFRKSIRTVCM